MKTRNFLAGAARLAAAAVIGMFVLVLTSCNNNMNTDEGLKTLRSSEQKEKTQENRDVTYYINDFLCVATENKFTQTMTSAMDFTLNGNVEEARKASIKAECSLNAEKDSVSRMDMSADNSGVVSLKGNDAVITYSDGQVLNLTFKTKAQYEKYLGTSYRHGYDSVTAVRPLAVKYEVKGSTRAAAAYVVKNLYSTAYPVEVTTTQFYGNSEVYQTHKDTLVVYGVTKELDKNGSNTTITDNGEEVLNEEQQKDSVVVTTTWEDGTTEKMTFNTILNRSLKNIERREVIVPDFANQTAGSSFSRVEGGESLVRSDANWSIYGHEVVISKMVSVSGHTEEVRYTYYQERADFKYNELSKSFGYVDWQIQNYADDFKPAMLSSKAGYDELDYTNEIKTSYLGYIQMSSEAIAWFKEQVRVVKYEVAEAYRDDDSDAFFTLVGLNKIAIYSDGTSEVVEKVNHKFPKSVAPLTNWVINTDVWGVYTSGEFEVSLGNKTAKSEDKFSFNEYTYNFSNEVSGQTNKGQAVVVNDIVYDDGDVRYEFANTELVVNKENEGTAFVGENEEKSTYSYACLAKVAFGASQTVTLPGTVNIAKPQQPQEPEVHLHGKVVATYCTSTPNENRSFWYNVAVIQFEDGYKMVGMADNNAMEFNFSMSSYAANINSAVCVNGSYVPAFAKDDSSSMKWYDEAGNKRVVLDYISATASAWNNGHNTIWDVRREGKISEDGYSVTFYLNGIAGVPMRF